MTILIPNKEIAQRWNGALEARLRQRPLENFLRSRGQKWVQSGDSRVTDNLTCATIYFVEESLGAFAEKHEGKLAACELLAVGEAACAVSHGLAALIEEPASWRITALVASARLLSPYIGLDAAAHSAATAARDYRKGLTDGSHVAEVLQITTAATGAVLNNDDVRASDATRLIFRRISSARIRFSIEKPRASAAPYDLAGVAFD